MAEEDATLLTGELHTCERSRAGLEERRKEARGWLIRCLRDSLHERFEATVEQMLRDIIVPLVAVREVLGESEDPATVRLTGALRRR